MQFIEGRPDIDYPCSWTYKIIGRAEADMREAIAGIVGDDAHMVTLSNHSAKGNYCSLNLEVTVMDEAHRTGIFSALMEHKSVKIVL